MHFFFLKQLFIYLQSGYRHIRPYAKKIYLFSLMRFRYA